MTPHPDALDAPTQEELAFRFAEMLRDCHEDGAVIPCPDCAAVAMPPIDERFLATLEVIIATGVTLHRGPSDRLN